MNPCESAQEWLARSRSEANTLPEEDARQLAHLSCCETCSALLDDYERFVSLSAQVLSYEPSAAQEEALLALFDQDPTQDPLADLVADAQLELGYEPSEETESRFLAAMREEEESSTPTLPGRRLGLPLLSAAAAILIAFGVWQWLPSAPVSNQLFEKRPSLELTLEGSVYIDGAKVAGQVTTEIAEGMELRTLEGARILVQDQKNALLTLEANTTAQIERWHPELTRLTLLNGALKTDLSAQRTQGRWEFLTPNIRAISKGDLSLRHVDGITFVHSLSSEVRVERPDGTLLEVLPKGESLQVEAPKVALAHQSSAPKADLKPQPKEPTLVRRASAKPKSLRPSTKRRPDKGTKPKVEAQNQPKPFEPRENRSRPESERHPYPLPAEEPTTQSERPGSSLSEARALLADDPEAAVALLESMEEESWKRDALLGDAYQLLRRRDEAIDAYERALEQASPPPSSVLSELARLLEKRGDKSLAAMQWQAYLDNAPKGPDAPRAHLFLGRGALDRDEIEEAESHLREVLERSTGSRQAKQALSLLGSLLIDQGRLSEAKELFGSHLFGKLAEIAHMGLIRVANAQKDVDEVKEQLEDYRARFPKGKYLDDLKEIEDSLP